MTRRSRSRRGQEDPKSRSPRWVRALLPAGLFVLSVSLYSPSIDKGFLYDDRALILKKPSLRSASDFGDLLTGEYYRGLPYYRPVTAATFAIQKTLHGDDAAPFHRFNVLTAGLIAILVYALLCQPGFRIARWAAVLATAAFIAHPVFSSCVDPISGRDSLFAMAFVIGSLLSFLRRTPARTAIGLALFALGLLSKEAAVVTPALVLLADALGFSEPRVKGARDWALRAASLLAVAAAYAAVRIALFAGGELRPGDPSLVPMSYVYLIQTTLAPFSELLYEPGLAAWMSIGRLALAAAILIAVGFAARGVWRSVRASLAFWLGWMVLALLPAANLVWQETQFDERYVALAALALVAAPAVVVSERSAGGRARLVASAIGWAIVAALAFVSWGRAPYFEELAFYRQWAKVRPQSVTPRFNLANALARRGRLDEAIEEYRTAITIDPGAVRAHYGLALTYVNASQLDSAILQFNEAVRLDPQFAEARDGLGAALARKGDMAGAEEQFRESLRLAPGNPNALRNLGYALVAQGKNEEAIARLREAIGLEPGIAVAHRYLGVALMRSGQIEAAERELREALRVAPGDREAAELLEQIRSGSSSSSVVIAPPR